MIFFDKIQDSLKYIEDNLDEDLSLNDVAKSCGFSLSQFYKIFLATTGFTVKEYIRNKRLSRAADQLVSTDKRIIDIALDSGFNSHESFTRAFSRLYGMNPKDYRMNQSDNLVFDNYNLFGKEIERKYLHMKDDIEIKVNILESNKIILVGMVLNTSVRDAIEKNTIDDFWLNNFVSRICEIKYINEPNVSIAYEIHSPEVDELIHFACVEVTSENAPDGMICKVIAPAKYAVFSVKRVLNPVEYSMLTQYIYGEWLPMSGYQLSSDFTINMNYSDVYYCKNYYLHALNTNSSLKVYIPIK